MNVSKDSLYEKANEILGAVPPNPDGTKSIDIEVIVELLQLIPIIYKCFKDHKVATQRVHNPSFFDRIKLRWAVRQKIGAIAFRNHGTAVVDGILALGKDATEDEVKKFVESCQV
jgi:hypothetical protein